jgi:hypothetical protein
MKPYQFIYSDNNSSSWAGVNAQQAGLMGQLLVRQDKQQVQI